MRYAIDTLFERVMRMRAPVCCGIDPVLDRLPDVYLSGRRPTFQDAADALEEFGCDIVDAVCDVVAAVKPQSAFFEMYGSAGIATLEHVVAHAHERGLVVIEDAKRNDIGNTARAYAAAHIGEVAVPGGVLPSAYAADFLTVSPYEGAEGIEPFVETATRTGRGVFVLVKTSNPGSLLVQGALTSDADDGSAGAMPVYERLARYVGGFAADSRGVCGYSGVGAVVGATYPEQAAALRALMPESLFLVPGYGAQGAGAREVVPCFNEDGLGAVVNSSRGVIYAYEKSVGRSCTREEYRAVTREAARAMRDDIYGTLKGAYPSIGY